ncbi:MAG: hypothetical protein LBI86_10870 [Treponema sp.]|nr:hypothetical protein [Treponema sp.]
MKRGKAFPALCAIVMGFVCTVLFAQTADGGIAAAENAAQLDAVVQGLAVQAGARLDALDPGSRVRVNDFFVSEDSLSPMGSYWKNQLLLCLAGRPNRQFILDNNTTGQAAYTLSGEILVMENMVRVYTHLGNVRESSLLSVWTTDLRQSSYLDGLISRFSSSSSSSNSGQARRDSLEEDSRDNPVEVSEGTWISRTIHSDDEDWFLFRSGAAGPYIAETSGGTDTFMELYDAGDFSRITENDDGGDDYNARIVFSAENGKSYLIKIRGYNNDDTGSYRFQVRAGE